MGFQNKPGVYEQIINQAIQESLDREKFLYEFEKIDSEEAFKVLGMYVSQVLEKALKYIKENEENKIDEKVLFCNKIINKIMEYIGDDGFSEYLIDNQSQLLLSISDKINNISSFNKKAEVVRPVSSIARTSIFTGTIYEPTMISEIKREILSADRIDFLVSFIKFSGLRLLLDELKEFTHRKKLRIITTSYMGATDPKAIEELRNLPNTEIKVSYETKRTRLHAKSYIFYRNSGYTTVYVGSSNMSNVAMSDGLEWNVKLTAYDMKENIEKIITTFEGYWNDKDFVDYREGDKEKFQQAIDHERKGKDEYEIDIDIRPYPYQQEILEKLKSERVIREKWKNLIVAATGTGKTMIAAFDYKNFVNDNKQKENKILFIAHREEILTQSIKTFRHVLRDHNFGEKFVGNHRPTDLRHLFMSIQTFNSQEFDIKVDPGYYDYIVVDEFHHSAASTYQKLLNHFTPKILLGLTATPERMDGKDVTDYFDNRVAAEIRLPEAIDRKILSPFHYFGITDTIDLSDVRWSRGGYNLDELEKNI